MKTLKQRKLIIYIIVVFLVTFMLCLSLSPLTNSTGSKINYKKSIPDSLKERQVSFHYLNYNLIFADLPEKDSFTNSDIIRVIDSYIWTSRRVFNDVFDAIVLSLICLKLFAYAFLSTNRRANKHISVIALSIGGHAPPNYQDFIIQPI